MGPSRFWVRIVHEIFFHVYLFKKRNKERGRTHIRAHTWTRVCVRVWVCHEDPYVDSIYVIVILAFIIPPQYTNSRLINVHPSSALGLLDEVLRCIRRTYFVFWVLSEVFGCERLINMTWYWLVFSFCYRNVKILTSWVTLRQSSRTEREEK